MDIALDFPEKSINLVATASNKFSIIKKISMI